MITAKARTYAASRWRSEPITPTVPRRERFHHAIDLLRLAGKTKRPAEKRAERDVKLRADEIVRVDEARVVAPPPPIPKIHPRRRDRRREEKSRRKDATANGSSASNTPARELARGLRLNREMAASTDAFAALAARETSGLGRARCSAFARRRLRRSDVLRSDVLRRFVVFARSMFVGI